MPRHRPLGPLILDLTGHQLQAEEREILAHPTVGGVILFTKNYDRLAQVRTLVEDIRRVREDLVITVDHEGGRVQRFRDGFVSLPAMATLGTIYDRDKQHALALARRAGWLLAAELRAIDVDMSFTPVLDLAGNTEVIGDRAFHHDTEAVVALAAALIAGLDDAGMSACGKHYPGHGSVRGDSHTELPVDTRPWHEIEQRDLRPFAALIEAGLPSVMPAHVLYPEVDHRPASLSPHWIGEVLRKRLKFDGAVICDDLSMAGAVTFGSLLDRANAALGAGCDGLILCHDRAGAIDLLDNLRLPADSQRSRRLAALRGRGWVDGLTPSAQRQAGLDAVAELLLTTVARLNTKEV